MWEKSKGTIKCEKRIVTYDVRTAQYEDEIVKYEEKKKGITKFEKRTVKCDVGTVQCDDETVKCEKKVTWYNRLSTSRYRTPFFFGYCRITQQWLGGLFVI